MTCLSRATVLLGMCAAMASATFCPGPRSDAFTFTPKVTPKGWGWLDVSLIFLHSGWKKQKFRERGLST